MAGYDIDFCSKIKVSIDGHFKTLIKTKVSAPRHGFGSHHPPGVRREV